MAALTPFLTRTSPMISARALVKVNIELVLVLAPVLVLVMVYGIGPGPGPGPGSGNPQLYLSNQASVTTRGHGSDFRRRLPFLTFFLRITFQTFKICNFRHAVKS